MRLSEAVHIDLGIRECLDVSTVDSGVEAPLVELKDIPLPKSIERTPRQAEANRKKRATIIDAERRQV